MEFDLRSAIDALDRQQVFEIANGARPAADYLFNNFLPSRNMNDYYVDNGSMTVKTTMAGMSGMDSRYAPGGAVKVSEFSGQTGKLTITAGLSEKQMRDLQHMLQRMTGQNMRNEQIQRVALNFVDKIITQALLDREEWLKGQALVTGALAWTMNGKTLTADYGVPSDHFIAESTGNDAWDGTSSDFWDDIMAIQEALDYDVRAMITSPTTMKAILGNAEVNQLQLVNWNQATGQFTLRRYVNRLGQPVQSTDPRETITLIAYGKKAEVFDLDNPGSTVKVPFMSDGVILGIGNANNENIFRIDESSTDETAIEPDALGYGHVAPTVEGGGTPGRWSRVYVPQDNPFEMIADGVENFLPVIERPELIAVASSEINGA